MKSAAVPPYPARSPKYRWVVAAVAFFAVFGAIGLGRFGYSAILPSMQKGLDISSAAAGSLASWNLAGYTIMAAIGGLFASRFGSRAIVTAGLAVTALGMFLTGMSGGLLSASAARLLTGMGNGMVLVPSMTLMGSWFDARHLGLASGVVPGGSSFALVIVGPVVPRIISGAGVEGWRTAWYFFAAMAAAMAVLALTLMRNRPRTSRHERSGTPARPSTLRTDLKGILRSKAAWHLGVVYFLYGFAFLLSFTFLQKRLIVDLGYSTGTAGNIFLILGIGGVISGVLWGGLSDRMGRGAAIAMTMAIQTAAAVVLALWSNVIALAVWGGIFGLCALSMPSLVAAACGDRFGARLAPASLGFVTLFPSIGQAAGPYVGGWLEDISGSLRLSYLLAAGVFAAGGATALFLREASGRRGGPPSGRGPDGSAAVGTDPL